MGNLKIRKGGVWVSPCDEIIKIREGLNWKQIIDGTKIFINGIWQNINCQSVALPDFDYLKITYSWTSAAGSDLDTFTGLINTLTAFDNDWVGYNQGDAKVPASSSTPYLWWAGDNTAGGKETVLVNFKQFLIDNPSVPNPIRIRMNAVWFAGKLTGNVSVGITTYKGGTMAIDTASPRTFDFINTGGVVVSDVSFNALVNVQSNSTLIANSENVAIVDYNQTNKTAVLNLV